MLVIDVPRTRERNRVLGALPAAQQAALATHLELVRLRAGQTLAIADEPLAHIYFPRDAVVSLLVPMEDGRAVEGATVGREGVVGLQVFLGDGLAAEEATVEIGGEAARMSAHAFRTAVGRSSELQTVLQRYTLYILRQMARTAACSYVHSVEQRSARWLLMVRDRLGRDTFPITHESLASLLGVRRASVTDAAGALQERGTIEYRRGWITILDVAGLESAACEDYALSRWSRY